MLHASRPRFTQSSLIALAAWTVVPAAGLAQTAPPASAAPASSTPASSAPEAANTVVDAQRHTAQALEHFRAHQYVEAIHEFELANRAAPAADYWFNIGRCHELLSQYDEAAEFYRRYLRDKVDPPDRADVERRIADMGRQAEQQRQAARIQNATATIRFDLGNTPAGTPVFLGDREVGRAPLSEPVVVQPGTYPLRVSAARMQEWRGQVRVRRGETAHAYVTLTPATAYETRSGGHLVSYIAAGLGVVALGTGIGFGIAAASQPACTGNIDTTMLDATCSRRDTASIADVFFGVSAGLLLTAAIVYFVEAASSHTERVQARHASAGRPGPWINE